MVAGVSELGHGCRQLWSINFTSCYQVTNAGISVLGDGCRQLQNINPEYCSLVTDAGVSALDHRIGPLQAASIIREKTPRLLRIHHELIIRFSDA